MLDKLRFLPSAVALAATGAAAVLHLRLLVWWLDRSGRDASQCRRIMSAQVLNWCSRVFRVWSATSGLVLDLPTRADLDLRGKRLIVIANHRSEYDIPLVAEVLRRLGIEEAQWVANSRLLEYPVLGQIFRDSAIPVDRKSVTGRDIRVVTAAARVAAREGQPVVMFPEGTTYRTKVVSPDWRGVLPPKIRGFATLAENLPGYGVLTVILSYGGPVRDSLIFGEDYLGRNVTVRVRYHPSLPPDPVKWLESEWREVERELADLEP